MRINLSAPETQELKPRIVVAGVGGAGGNAVNNMIAQGLSGVEFIVANTDAQALNASRAERRIQLGSNVTQGLGCGARPNIGKMAAEEAIEQIIDHLQGTHMAFITAGMGGGTGTGAAPVIARACRDKGMLTVGVVTKPFHFEGTTRMRIAEQGIEELQQHVDTLIIIPNQNLFRIANEKTTFADAFAMADQVLHSGVRGITDLMVVPGLINLDFADVKTVMSEMGKAMMGTGEADGDDRAVAAAEAAIANPLLDDVSIKGARGVLINITGGMDLTLHEVDEAANKIRDSVDPDANIIVGAALDENLSGRVRVSVVATGIDAVAHSQADPAGEAESKIYSFARQQTPARARPAAPAASGGGRAMGYAGGAAAVALQPEPEPARPETAHLAVEDLAPVVAEPVAPAAPAEAVLPARPAVPDAKPLSPEPQMVQSRAAVAHEMRDEPFIPPRAHEPEPAVDQLRQPEPMREADAVNAGRADAPARSRAGNLLGKMTGLFGAAGVAAEPSRSPVRRAEPVLEKGREPAQPPAARAAEPTAPRPAPAPRAEARRVQEDDLLDIPTFLRRQAN